MLIAWQMHIKRRRSLNKAVVDCELSFTMSCRPIKKDTGFFGREVHGSGAKARTHAPTLSTKPLSPYPHTDTTRAVPGTFFSSSLGTS